MEYLSPKEQLYLEFQAAKYKTNYHKSCLEDCKPRKYHSRRIPVRRPRAVPQTPGPASYQIPIIPNRQRRSAIFLRGRRRDGIDIIPNNTPGVGSYSLTRYPVRQANTVPRRISQDN